MNGKDVVAVIMAVNKLDGPCFTSEDEDVSPRETCLPMSLPCMYVSVLLPSMPLLIYMSLSLPIHVVR